MIQFNQGKSYSILGVLFKRKLNKTNCQKISLQKDLAKSRATLLYIREFSWLTYSRSFLQMMMIEIAWRYEWNPNFLNLVCRPIFLNWKTTSLINGIFSKTFINLENTRLTKRGLCLCENCGNLYRHFSAQEANVTLLVLLKNSTKTIFLAKFMIYCKIRQNCCIVQEHTFEKWSINKTNVILFIYLIQIWFYTISPLYWWGFKTSVFQWWEIFFYQETKIQLIKTT